MYNYIYIFLQLSCNGSAIVLMTGRVCVCNKYYYQILELFCAESERQIGELTQQLQQATQRAAQAEAGTHHAERRAVQAEVRAREVEGRLTAAQEESRDKDRRLALVGERVREMEGRVAEEQARQTEAEQRARERGERLQEAEQRVRDLEGRVVAAERRLAQEEGRRRAAEQRVEGMEERVRVAGERQREADERLVEAEGRKRQAEERLGEAIQRLQEADQRRQETNQRQQEAVQRQQEAISLLRVAENRLATETERRMEAERLIRQMEDRLREAERVANALQGSSLEQHDEAFWMVERGEIQLTQRELGRGGWAAVKVAEFRGLQVAAKCLHAIIISDYNRQLFVREMSIAAKLRHPNLVQFIGATLEGEPVILTELMASSLRAVLERGPLDLAHITSVARDVARALNYLHLTRPDPILHRDVSSANVLLNPGPGGSWLAKLSDYGSANFTRQVRTAGPGNPSYAAPEAAVPSQQSPKMDVFSFGVLLVEMATRRFPDKDVLAAQIRQVTVPRLPELIRRCTNANPSRRPDIRDVLTQL